MNIAKLHNVHPGEVLPEEFLNPMRISQNALARATEVPPHRINEIVLGKRGISADTALRLARVFGTSESFWMGLRPISISKPRAMRSPMRSTGSKLSPPDALALL